MSVKLGDRKESKVQFDAVYFKVYRDAVDAIKNNFGARKEIADASRGYINHMASAIMKSVTDIGTYIRIANSIYPVYQSELEERRIAQDKAIGLCFDVLTKYQLVMETLQVPGDKHVDVIKRLGHEINCLKKWRASDNRFKNLK